MNLRTKEMGNIKFVKIIDDINVIRAMISNLMEDDFGFSGDVRQRLIEMEKSIDELTMEELDYVAHSDFFTISKVIYNFVNENNEYLLPHKYTSVFAISEKYNIVALDEFGFQSIYLYDLLNGDKLEGGPFYDVIFWDNNIIFIQHLKNLRTELFKFKRESGKIQLESLSKHFNFSEPPTFYYGNTTFYKHGFINIGFESLSPFCFDNGRCFINDLAAVCLNGRWGFINDKNEVVIDFKYAYVDNFDGEYTLAVQLFPEFISERGIWIERTTNLAYHNEFILSTEEFIKRYPAFPKTHRVPLYKLRNPEDDKLDYRQEYSFFNDDYFSYDLTDDRYSIYSSHEKDLFHFGKLVVIDKKGTVVFDNPSNFRLKLENKYHVKWIENDYQITYDLNKNEIIERVRIHNTEEKIAVDVNLFLKSPADFKNFISNTQNWNLLIDSEITNNKELMLLTIVEDPFNLRFASDRLKSDIEFVKCAILSDFRTASFASDALKNSFEFVNMLLFHANREFQFEIIFNTIPLSFRDNKFFMLSVIKNSSLALKFASDRLRADPEVRDYIISRGMSNFRYFNSKVPDYDQIALDLIASSSGYMIYIPDEKYIDRLFVKKAILRNPDAFQHCSVLYADDVEICEIVMKYSTNYNAKFSDRVKKILGIDVNLIQNVCIENDDDLPM